MYASELLANKDGRCKNNKGDTQLRVPLIVYISTWEILQNLLNRYKKVRRKQLCLRRTGAEGGIRTPARFYPPTPLAGEPLIATWVLLQVL